MDAGAGQLRKRSIKSFDCVATAIYLDVSSRMSSSRHETPDFRHIPRITCVPPPTGGAVVTISKYFSLCLIKLENLIAQFTSSILLITTCICI